MSSIRPRVFIKAPNSSDSRHGIFIIRLTSAVPPSLPTVATTIIPKQMSQSRAPSSRPICVRKPMKAKKSGSSKDGTKMFDPQHQLFAETTACRHHDSGQESAEKRMNADDFRAQRGDQDNTQNHGQDSFGRLRFVQKRSFKKRRRSGFMAKIIVTA